MIKKYSNLPILFSLFFLLVLFDNHFVKADLNQLISCENSPQFHRRLDNTVRKLEIRLKKYEKNSLPFKNIIKQINATKIRFEKYEKANLLCGKDGLPHLIADGRFDHAKEFIIPGILFLYITGWIGWVGRKYIQYSSTTKNPTEKEIIIDIPYAVKSMTSGFVWPFEAWHEFTNGKLFNLDKDITISPR
jgi:photosystem I subunit 3